MTPSPQPPLLVGLDDDELAMTAEEFFARFRWEPPSIDPDELSAEDFLRLL